LTSAAELYTYQDQFGGPEEGKFWFPTGIAIDPDGVIYVADRADHRIQKFSTDGQFISPSIGALGLEEKDLITLKGIAIDQSGNLYVADRDELLSGGGSVGNSRVRKYDNQGNFIRSWGENTEPFSVACDNNGFVYVVESGIIRKYDSDGNFQKSWQMRWGSDDNKIEVCGAKYIASDTSGYIYVNGEYRSYYEIQKFDSDGNYQWGKPIPTSFAIGTSLAGIAIDNTGNVWTVDNQYEDNQYVHTLYKFDSSDGQLLASYDLGLHEGILNFMAIDDQNNIYITQTGGTADLATVEKFSSTGQFLGSWGGNSHSAQGHLKGPSRIAIDPDGNLLITDVYNNRVQKFSPDGQSLGMWGEKGENDGQLIGPQGIAINSTGFIYVADGKYILDSSFSFYKYRIQAFRQDSQFVNQWYAKFGQYGIAITPSDEILTPTAKYAPDGTLIKYFDLSGVSLEPFDVACDSLGNIYLASDQQVHKLDPGGLEKKTWSNPRLYGRDTRGPNGIFVDHLGYVYVVDTQNDPESNDVGPFEIHNVKKFTANGEFIGEWGKFGGAPGELYQPTDLVIAPDNAAYVVDTGNNRVQKFVLSDPYTVGSIAVNSTPLGAKIFLDGVDTGMVTPDIICEVSPGIHEIRLEMEGYPNSETSVVVDAGEMKRIKLSWLNNPTITTLTPTTITAGSDAFTLQITGTNFVNGAKVLWDGQERATAFISATKLTATIAKADVANEGTYKVKVVNPDGKGSNEVNFTVQSDSSLIAEFTASVASGPVPLQVTFFDQSDGDPESWFWEFGDGGVSNVQNPSHTYNSIGEYTVNLTVNSDGFQNTTSKYQFICIVNDITGDYLRIEQAAQWAVDSIGPTAEYADHSLKFINAAYNNGSNARLDIGIETYDDLVSAISRLNTNSIPPRGSYVFYQEYPSPWVALSLGNGEIIHVTDNRVEITQYLNHPGYAGWAWPPISAPVILYPLNGTVVNETPEIVLKNSIWTERDSSEQYEIVVEEITSPLKNFNTFSTGDEIFIQQQSILSFSQGSLIDAFNGIFRKQIDTISEGWKKISIFRISKNGEKISETKIVVTVKPDESTQPLFEAPWQGEASITQGNFGTRSHNDGFNNYALDIGIGGKSFNVLCPADGWIVESRDNGEKGEGNFIIIKHNSTSVDYYTWYLHLNERKKNISDGFVKKGELIGISGETGNSEGIHLHFMLSRSASYKSIPFERLRLKDITGGDTDFIEYNASKNQLLHSAIGGHKFLSDNKLYEPIIRFNPEKPMVGGNIKFDLVNLDYDEFDEYEWDFNDGKSLVAPVPSHVFLEARKYQIRVFGIKNEEKILLANRELDLSLEPGDILFERGSGGCIPFNLLVPGEWTHSAMYIGNNKIVHSANPVKISQISDWAYPHLSYVQVVRVRTIPEIKQKAIEFALQQADKKAGFDWHWWTKDENGDTWYCSELIWAAYKKASNGEIDFDNPKKNFNGIAPDEIANSPLVEFVGHHIEERPGDLGINIMGVALCPVNLEIKDPDGFIINNSINQIPFSEYFLYDLNGDSIDDKIIIINYPKVGSYSLSVIPVDGADLNDAYSIYSVLDHYNLENATALAENTIVQDIPNTPYYIVSNVKIRSSFKIVEDPYDSSQYNRTFSDTSTGNITSRHWSFGDGTFAENVTEITHTYTQSGNYTVTLTVSGPDGEDSASQIIQVLPSTPGWKFRSDNSNSGVYDDGGTKPDGRLLWTYTTDGGVYSSPTVTNGIVYFGSNDNKLYALDAETGTYQWSYSTNHPVQSSPAVVNDVVYVGSSDNHVYAIDALTGAYIWDSTTGLWGITSSPAIANGLVYIGGNDYKVYAFNVVTGAQIWSYQTNGSVQSSPAVADGILYVGSFDGNLYALDAGTGAQIWRYLTGGIVTSSPSVVNGTVYIGSSDYNVYALDARTGTYLWNYSTGGPVQSSPAVTNGVFYVGSSDGKVYALDADTGTVIWSYLTTGIVESSPALANGIVYVGSAHGGGDSRIYALDAETGSYLWSFTTQGVVTTSPAVANGIVYIGCDDGKIYALGGDQPPESPDSVTNLHNTTYQQTLITWNWTDPSTADFSHVMVYRDGIFQTNVTAGVQSFTATGLSHSTAYTIGTRTVGITGIINQTWVNQTAKTTPLAPLANFTANTTLGQIPLPIHFTDNSTGENITSRLWTFGDGGTSNETEPIHVYTTPGLFTVSLDVTNDGGSNTSTRTNYIRVFDATPITDFIADLQSGDAPLTVQFYDTTVGSPSSWQWNFGDGKTSTIQSPAHTYTTPGNYSVTLTAGSSGGTNTTVKTDYIQVIQRFPVANFTASPMSGPIPLAVNFTDLSTGQPTSWSWEFGDGNTSDSPNPANMYSAPGTFTITLTVENQYGTDSVTKRDFVTAGELPHADFNASTTTTYTNQYIEFQDLSIGEPMAYFWDFGDGTTSDYANPWTLYAEPGNYTVSLTVGNQMGNDTETKTDYISVSPHPPYANFDAFPRDGSFPLTVTFYQWSYGGYYDKLTYEWDFGDGSPRSTSAEHEVVHTYMQSGVYNVNLTVSADGLSHTEQKGNYIGKSSPPPPVAGFTATPRSGDAPLTVSFIDQSSGSPPLTYFWDFGDVNTSTEQNPVHQYYSPNSYNVTLTVTNAGGESTEFKESYVTVGAVAPLNADFASNVTNGTIPLAVQFIDTSSGNPGAWSWIFQKDTYYPVGHEATVQAIPSFGNEFSSEKNPIVSYTYPGNYSVSLTVSRIGETDTITKEGFIRVDPPAPQVDFSAWPREGAAPLEVEFYANVPYSWYYDEFLWNFGDGTNGSGDWVSHTYIEPGLYPVNLTVTSMYGTNSTTKVDFINVTAPVPPIPDFEGVPLAGNAPLDVVFTDTSTGVVTTRFWDFGDGTTAWSNATQSLAHTYPFPGTYTVSLTAGNDGGQVTATKTGYVLVNPSGVPPYAAFLMRPSSGVAPLTVSFTDRSRGTPTAWLWDFGDGNTSTEQNPVHTYSSMGTFRVRLTAKNSGGSSTYGSFVWVRSPHFLFPPLTPSPTVTPTPVIPPQAGRPPISLFLTNASFGSAPMTVQFTDLSLYNPTSWEWEFGDGSTSMARNPVYTYTAPGTYIVVLSTANPQGESIMSRRILVR
jgi:PKD repeat protein